MALGLAVGLHAGRFAAESPGSALWRATLTMPPTRAGGPCRRGDDQPLGAIVRASEVPGIVHELKPNLDTCFRGQRLRTNHEGLRAIRQYSQRKPAGTFRILGLGDSLMFGQGVDEQETYGSYLEQWLSTRRGRPVEFVNTAVPGYNTAIEAAVLEQRGLRYEPNVILLHWCWNDFGLPQFLQQQALTTPLDRLAWWGMRLGSLTSKPGFNTSRQTESRATLVEMPAKLMLYPQPGEAPAAYRRMVGFQGVERAVEHIALLTSRRPRKIPVVVLVPRLDDDPYRVQPQLEQVFVSRGLWVVPIDHSAQWWLSADDRHLNMKGHRYYARTIIDTLDALRLLP